MTSWIRRNFDSVGLTQYPPGRYLPSVQRQFGGTVLLCIDVSGSMMGEPLSQAIAGGLEFLREATENHYRCGLILWHHGVHTHLAPDTSADKVAAALTAATSVGGNNLVPTLTIAKDTFDGMDGDRVLCVFGDGDIGEEHGAVALARELCALGVRIMVRGLGAGATAALSRILCPGSPAEHGQVIVDLASIGTGIASMAKGLSARDPGR